MRNVTVLSTPEQIAVESSIPSYSQSKTVPFFEHPVIFLLKNLQSASIMEGMDSLSL